MAWITPKEDWSIDPVGSADFNRIEGNTAYLKAEVDDITYIISSTVQMKLVSDGFDLINVTNPQFDLQKIYSPARRVVNIYIPEFGFEIVTAPATITLEPDTTWPTGMELCAYLYGSVSFPFSCWVGSVENRYSAILTRIDTYKWRIGLNKLDLYSDIGIPAGVYHTAGFYPTITVPGL